MNATHIYPKALSFNAACAQLEPHGYNVNRTVTTTVNGWDNTCFYNAVGEIVAIHDNCSGTLVLFGDSTAT